MLSFEWNYELTEVDKDSLQAERMSRIHSVWWEYRVEMYMGEWWG